MCPSSSSSDCLCGERARSAAVEQPQWMACVAAQCGADSNFHRLSPILQKKADLLLGDMRKLGGLGCGRYKPTNTKPHQSRKGMEARLIVGQPQSARHPPDLPLLCTIGPAQRRGTVVPTPRSLTYLTFGTMSLAKARVGSQRIARGHVRTWDGRCCLTRKQ